MYPIKSRTLLLTIGLIICLCYSSFGQTLDLKPKFFTLRNSRITFGLIGQINTTMVNDMGEVNSLLQVPLGNLPDASLEITHNEEDFPYFSGGLHLDWFSPNSRLGLSFGAEYSSNRFQIGNSSTISKYNFQNVLIPVWLRYKFGSIHGTEGIRGKENAFLSLGPYLSIPVAISRQENGNDVVNYKNIQQNSLGLSAVFGLIIRMKKNDAIVKGMITSEYPRLWVFLRADYLLNNMIDPAQNIEFIRGYSNQDLELRNLNLSLGAACLFGGKLKI